MSLVARPEDRVGLRATDFRNDNAAILALGLAGQDLLVEIYGLYQMGLLHDTGGGAWLSVPDVAPRRIQLQATGATLAQVMGMPTSVPEADKVEVRHFLT